MVDHSSHGTCGEEMEEGSNYADKGKGKGKEPQNRCPPASPTLPTAPDTNSIPERVINSATSLSRSLLNEPGPAEWRATGLAVGEKNRVGEGSGGQKHSLGYKMRQAAEGSGVRGATQRGDSRSDFESFLKSRMPAAIEEMGGNADFGQPRSETAEEQERRDGDEVISVLEDPHFALEDDAEDQSTSLSPSDAKRLRAALFTDGETRGSRWNHLLNFWPIAAAELGQTSNFRNGERPLDDATARDVWLGDWKDVLLRYTDEVWGGLAPIVDEARAEVTAAGEDETGNGSQPNLAALGRLRMVLAHLRGW